MVKICSGLRTLESYKMYDILVGRYCVIGSQLDSSQAQGENLIG